MKLYQTSKSMYNDNETILIDGENSKIIGTVEKIDNITFRATYLTGKNAICSTFEMSCKFIESLYYPINRVNKQANKNQLSMFN